MKFISSQLAFFFQNKRAKSNIKFLLLFILILIGLIIAFSLAFHIIMEAEGQEHSWLTGFYWTLTVMSTLGFGDITFQDDFGRAFSIIVLITGVLFLLVLLPFTFIQFFYAPWIDAQNKARAPRELSTTIKNHVIFTSFDEISIALIDKIKYYGREYVVIIEDLQKALELYDLGYKVGLGKIDDPETYKKMQIEQAALLFATNNDEMNTNVAFTVRELTDKTPIVTTADSVDSVDILELAGSNLILEPRKMIGESLARRTIGGGALSSKVGNFENLIIAEAPAMGTPLVGKTLSELQLRKKIGINVIGFWEQGKFINPTPDYIINKSSVLVIAGTDEQISLYDEVFVIFEVNANPVVIIGSGRVGAAVAKNLLERNIEFLFIERDAHSVLYPENTIVGNAADYKVLERAGILKAPSVIISTSEDAMNIYLTIYCRRLRPDIQIISRANLDRNVSTLNRAGADLVMSYPSLAANAAFNFLIQERLLMLSEGIDIFKVKTPTGFIGKNLIESNIRNLTGCSVIGIKSNDEIKVNPDPYLPIEENTELLLIGSIEAERKFIKTYF